MRSLRVRQHAAVSLLAAAARLHGSPSVRLNSSAAMLCLLPCAAVQLLPALAASQAPDMATLLSGRLRLPALPSAVKAAQNLDACASQAQQPRAALRLLLLLQGLLGSLQLR